LHGGGALGAPGVRTRLSPSLARYRFASPPGDPRPGLEADLALIDVAPRPVTIPLLGLSYRAATASLLPSDCTHWIVGPSGALKTTLASLSMNHHCEFDRTRPTANWSDTAAAIEDLLYFAKDVMVLIDDFAPKSGETADGLRAKAEMVLRAV